MFIWKYCLDQSFQSTENFLTACLFLQNELFHEGNAMLVKVKLEPEAPCRK